MAMRKTSWIFAALLALPMTLAAAVEETEEMTFAVNPGARISLENINGDIDITGGAGDEVKVVARKKAKTKEYLAGLQIVSDADADYVRIETRHPKRESGWFNWGSDGSGSVTYELSVPANVDLDTIETVNGDVRIRAVAGAVKASTVNGGLDLENLTSDANLETVNGRITAAFDTLGAGQRVDAEAVNGRIEILLPADASARVSAETVNGSIDADDFGLEAEKGFVGRDLSGDIGDGGARLSIDTVNGSITISRK
jgi:DUF4097 and DUF4098 domain-containing protein YvlB